MRSAVLSSVGIVLLVLVGLSLGANSSSFVFNLSGGAPFCAQCGSPGAYACSTDKNWPGTWSFSDSTQLRGRVVSNVQVIIEGGFGCKDAVAPVVRVSLNGVPVDNFLLNTTGCECGDCGGTVTFSRDSPYGWPGYQSGSAGRNNLTIWVSGGSVCLNNIVVNVRYAVPSFQINSLYSSFALGGDSTTNICGRSSFSYLTKIPSGYTFHDPLPSNSIAYSLEIWLFGTYFDDRTFSPTCTNASVVMSLNSFTLSKSSLAYPRSFSDNDNILRTPCSFNGCDGIWRFASDKFYTNGVPSYVYGGYNSLAPIVVTGGNYQMAISEIGLVLYYLPRPSLAVVQEHLGQN